jgi:nuclear transport factor 2 (NTF2) superfamily protein
VTGAAGRASRVAGGRLPETINEYLCHEHGLRLRIASINDAPIKESDRIYHWPLGRRPDSHPSLSDLGL